MSPFGPTRPRGTLLLRLLFRGKADSLCSERALPGVTHTGSRLRRWLDVFGRAVAELDADCSTRIVQLLRPSSSVSVVAFATK